MDSRRRFGVLLPVKTKSVFLHFFIYVFQRLRLYVFFFLAVIFSLTALFTEG